MATAGVLGALGMCCLGHVYVHIYGQYAHGCHVSPECFCCMYVGSQAASGPLLILVPRVPWMSFGTGLFPHSYHVARIQHPEPVSSVPSSPALASSVVLPLPRAPWKCHSVWVHYSIHASPMPGPVFLSGLSRSLSRPLSLLLQCLSPSILPPSVPLWTCGASKRSS